MFDFAVIGAGMAGASITAELAGSARVVMLEAEDQPGYHATGRSAAFWDETYGGIQIQPLTSASGLWLKEHGFLSPRGAVTIAKAGEGSALKQFIDQFTGTGLAIEQLERSELLTLVPGLAQNFTAGAYQSSCSDIDVAAMHAHYLRAANRGGAALICNAGLRGAVRRDFGWQLTLADGRVIEATRLINAAGAWADEIAVLAGVAPIGITPLRRTVIQLRVTPAPDDAMPLVLDLGGQFYFKPQSGRLWLSPHDETPSPPCDAAAEEIDVALAIDRFQQAVDWKVEAIEHSWAGLRSFAPDRLPVYGADPLDESFIWFAGQGGFGIQTAPAAAQLLAAELLGNMPDPVLKGVDRELYSPIRLRGS